MTAQGCKPTPRTTDEESKWAGGEREVLAVDVAPEPDSGRRPATSGCPSREAAAQPGQHHEGPQGSRWEAPGRQLLEAVTGMTANAPGGEGLGRPKLNRVPSREGGPQGLRKTPGKARLHNHYIFYLQIEISKT